MLVNLDKFELLYFINGCAIGSHLRQGIWKRCVDEFYGKLNDKERAFIYQFSLRDFWEIMAMEKYPNVNKEYPRFGFEDYKKFLACYNPNNRYNVKFEGVPEGKKKVKKEEAITYLSYSTCKEYLHVQHLEHKNPLYYANSIGEISHSCSEK